MMTHADIVRLFVVLAGYWPTSAPDPEDQVAVAAHLDLLGDLDLDVAKGAARYLAHDGREFCPPPGVLAAATRPAKVGPERNPYVLEDPDPDVVDPDTARANIAAIRELLGKLGRGVTTEDPA